MINRLKSEFAAMKTGRRVFYGVALSVSLVIAVLLLTGIWDPMAVPTS